MKDAKRLLWLLLILFVTIMLIFGAPYDSDYAANYFVNCICGFCVAFLLWYYAAKRGFDILEPLYLISTIYGLMFFITPIYDLLTDHYLWFGYDLFPSGVEASLIALAGYFAFYILYAYNFRFSHKEKHKIKRQISYDFTINNQLLVKIILLMYFLSLIANIYYLLHSSGLNLTYILTFGLLSTNGVNDYAQVELGFLSMFSYCLPAATLLYWEYGDSRILKIVLFLIMFLFQVTRGFRFFIIQIIITFVTYIYLKKNKRPEVKSIILALIVIMIPVLFMTLFRNSIRIGEGVDTSVINLDNIQTAFDGAFWDNLRIYQNFYGMVDKIPSEYPFVYGRQIIVGTLIMVIPRVVWANKLPSSGGVGLDVIVGSRLVGTGQAYPNIGEFYYACGVLGVIGFMALYGWWMKYVKRNYMPINVGVLNNMKYSILFGVNLQLIIRGYTPSNFWYIVFSLIPIWIVEVFVRKKKCDQSARLK